MQWYKSNQRLFREARDALASKRLQLEIVGPGTAVNQYVGLKIEAAVARGILVLEVPGTTRKYEYEIALVFPDDYPKHPPTMYGNDPKLPVDIDRHMITGGQACLGAPSEVRRKWASAPNIIAFVDEIVAPFLAWQVYYDTYGCPPEWGQRSHGKEGILEFYAEILGLETSTNIEGFMTLLARKNTPGGHEFCPCGSGQRLRNCHKDSVMDARQRVLWHDVLADLDMIKRSTTLTRTQDLAHHTGENIRRKRFQFLRRLYEVTRGDQHISADMWELGKELGFTEQETDAIEQYLSGENLINPFQGGDIFITHWGVVQYEEAVSKPDKPTEYFPPVTIINAGQNC